MSIAFTVALNCVLSRRVDYSASVAALCVEPNNRIPTLVMQWAPDRWGQPGNFRKSFECFPVHHRYRNLFQNVYKVISRSSAWLTETCNSWKRFATVGVVSFPDECSNRIDQSPNRSSAKLYFVVRATKKTRLPVDRKEVDIILSLLRFARDHVTGHVVTILIFFVSTIPRFYLSLPSDNNVLLRPFW